MEKSKLLDRCGAEGEDRLLLAKVLDRAAQAEERNIPACTDFLSPQQQMMAGEPPIKQYNQIIEYSVSFYSYR